MFIEYSPASSIIVGNFANFQTAPSIIVANFIEFHHLSCNKPLAHPISVELACAYVCIYIYIYTHTKEVLQKQRAREREQGDSYICVCEYIYIYEAVPKTLTNFCFTKRARTPEGYIWSTFARSITSSPTSRSICDFPLPRVTGLL